jgi:hypothetical protein
MTAFTMMLEHQLGIQSMQQQHQVPHLFQQAPAAAVSQAPAAVMTWQQRWLLPAAMAAATQQH